MTDELHTEIERLERELADLRAKAAAKDAEPQETDAERRARLLGGQSGNPFAGEGGGLYQPTKGGQR